jgi:transposase
MQTKYIGLDAHSSTCTFCVLDSQGVELGTRTIATNGRLLVDYVKSLGKNIHIVFEECDLSFWLFDILHKHVAKIVVCNPAANIPYKRAKTDKLDARNLAHLLRGGYLKPVFHDGSARERFRMLVSGYEDTIQDSTRLKNRIRAVKRRTRSGEKQTPVEAKFILDQLNERQDHLNRMCDEYRDKLAREVKHFREVRYLISIPGIQYIQAAKIIAQVVDPGRFKNKYKFFAYCGLVRHPRQSAKRSYGSVRVFGNSSLKCVFKMAAHSALTGNGCLRQYYEALRTRGLSDKAARNAVARKIAAVTLSMWRNKKTFNEQMIVKSLPVKG